MLDGCREDNDDEPAPSKKSRAPKAGKAEAGDKGKKARKKKDPNAPKKALPAFMFFSNKMRDTIKSENPGIAFGDVSCSMAELVQGSFGFAFVNHLTVIICQLLYALRSPISAISGLHQAKRPGAAQETIEYLL